MSLDVLCIGHAAYDVLFYLERFPSENSKTQISFSLESGGGPAANAAYLLSKWGVFYAFAGVIGDDYYGQQILAEFQSVGTDTSLLEVCSGFSTPLSLILINQQTGSRTVVNRKAVNSTLRPQPIALAGVFPRILLFEGNKELFQLARRCGMEVSIDLNWDPLWGSADAKEILERKQAIRAVLPWITLAHGNVQELNEFADSADLERTLNLLIDWGVQGAVVHMGEQGAGYFHDHEMTVAPPVRAIRRVNTTGTGDVLSVCMMLLYHQSEFPPLEKLHLSNSIVSQFIEGKRQLIPLL